MTKHRSEGEPVSPLGLDDVTGGMNMHLLRELSEVGRVILCTSIGLLFHGELVTSHDSAFQEGAGW